MHGGLMVMNPKVESTKKKNTAYLQTGWYLGLTAMLQLC